MLVKKKSKSMAKELDSGKLMYSPGSNDECYTPLYGVTPILKYIPKDAIVWCPFDTFESLTGKLEDSPLTFVLPGLWLVVSVMTVIMYNAEIIVWIGNKTFGAISSFKAVFKISVAYPMASRFRTGLTVTMFALVIFTLVIFATLKQTVGAIVKSF